MPLYELGIIVDPEVPPEDETSALERLEGIITDADGEMLGKDTWGRRQLAYPIQKKNYGVYHFWRFNVGGDALERLNDAVMRSLILNMDRELRRKRKMDAKYEARAAKKAAKAEAKAKSAGDED